MDTNEKFCLNRWRHRASDQVKRIPTFDFHRFKLSTEYSKETHCNEFCECIQKLKNSQIKFLETVQKPINLQRSIKSFSNKIWFWNGMQNELKQKNEMVMDGAKKIEIIFGCMWFPNWWKGPWCVPQTHETDRNGNRISINIQSHWLHR